MAYHAHQGDIIWLNFDPQTGHEQKCRHPAFVVSNNRFNRFEKQRRWYSPLQTQTEISPSK
jgi:mRNA interferase MazF